MSYTLLKPCADMERVQFIVRYNHNMGLEIAETEKAIYALEANEIMVEGEPIVDPDYEEKQRQKELARIMALSMTRSDFFDGMIKAFGIDSDELLLVIEQVLDRINLTEIEKKVAINNYKNALHFYRKHPLFSILSNIEIPIAQGVSIIITEEQWNKFFDETNKGNADAYTFLLPPREEE